MVPKYQWLAGLLEEWLRQNSAEGKRRLPTEQELCQTYQVSRQTVRSALALLEKNGAIFRKQGSGSYPTGQLSGLRGGEIGVMLCSSQEYIYPAIFADIEEALSQNSFSAKLFVTQNSISREREILQSLLQTPPRGLIAEGCKSGLPNPNLDLYRKLMKKGCEIVFLFNFYPALTGCTVIKDDNYSGSALLVRHLHSHGHTAIGGIFKADDMQGIERYQGYLETLRSLELPIADSCISWFNSRDLYQLTAKKDYTFLKETVMDALSDCTAVVCYNDLIAYALAEYCLSSGYRLPEDLSIASFDNSFLSSSGAFSLTTLSHPPHELGRKAAQTVLKKIKGLPVHSQEAQWQLIQRESTTFFLRDTLWD